MGKRSKTGVLKRLREIKKAEKAALKRDQVRTRREAPAGPGAEEPAVADNDQIATDEDLAGYGFPVGPDDDDDDSR